MQIDVIKRAIELVPEVKVYLSEQVLDILTKRVPPKQSEKNAMERKLTLLMTKRFKWEAEHITGKLQAYFPDRKGWVTINGNHVLIGEEGDEGGGGESNNDKPSNEVVGKTRNKYGDVGAEIYKINDASNLLEYRIICDKINGNETFASNYDGNHGDILREVDPNGTVDDYIRYSVHDGEYLVASVDYAGVARTNTGFNEEKAFNNIYKSLDRLVGKGLERSTRVVIVGGSQGKIDTTAKSIKAIQPPLPYDEWWDEWNEWDDNEIIPALVNIILGGALGGVSQFAQGMTFDMDWTTANQHAAKWAREHAGQLIKDLNDTSSKIIKDAISAFIETPGMTVGDIIDQITQTGFSEVRAQMIATTETTTAYAQGQLEASKEMQKENPDLKMVKVWFTDNDDRVCDICGPLHLMEIEWDKPFPSGDMDPPAHVNCRCAIDYSTKIDV